MKNIEVEVRAFISKADYTRLLRFMKRNARFVKTDHQITYYFSGSHDLRIQKTDTAAKLWPKRGRLHDRYREGIEIQIDREDFDKLEALLTTLGFEIEVKWFRHRHIFMWNGVNVMLDYTRGYEYIIELEQMCEPSKKNKIYEKLKNLLRGLGVKLTLAKSFKKDMSITERDERVARPRGAISVPQTLSWVSHHILGWLGCSACEI
jgi:predicted adenylyl cyclase CyaB